VLIIKKPTNDAASAIDREFNYPTPPKNIHVSKKNPNTFIVKPDPKYRKNVIIIKT
jgi:hypothetical protein